MRNDNDYEVYEDYGLPDYVLDRLDIGEPPTTTINFANDAGASTTVAAPAPPSDQQIKEFVQANIGNPELIAQTAAQYGVSVADLSRATGYDPTVVVDYFKQAEVPPPPIGGLTATKVEEPPRPPDIIERQEPPTPPPIKDVVEPPRPPIKEIVETNAPVDLGDGTFRTPGGTIIDKDGRPVTKAADTATTTASTDTTKTSTLPSVTDIDGHTYDGTQLLTLAQQIAQNAGSMSGGVFQDRADRVGFDQSEAEKLLGRKATPAEQVLLDMSRFLMQSGVTDLSQLKTGDVKSNVNVNETTDEEGNKKYYITYGVGDDESPVTRELTKDEVAKIKTEEVMGDAENGPYVRKTIENVVTGKGLFANGKTLANINPSNDPISYHIGQTYVGKGGTNYELKFDPTTGKSVINSSGFSTSDAGAIMPIIMIASNFLLPGVGTALTSTLAEAGLGELASQVVSKAVINGVTSGIMAEASGGKFGDGFLKGSITGAISAGVAPVIQTALPSDLSPAVSNALTRAGTSVVTALATGRDAGTALTNSLLNSAVGGGISSLSGEAGLSTSDARLLTSVLTPVVTQLITNGNVSDATLMNAVLLAGSTVLANTDSKAIDKTTDVTTNDSQDANAGGLNLLARDAANVVGTGLSTAATATGLANKLTSLTNVPDNKAIKTKANLTGALKTTKPAGALTTAKKTLTAQQMSEMKASKPPAKVNVANLIPIKKPPQKVDVKTLIPVKTAQLPAGLNTKKMG